MLADGRLKNSELIQTALDATFSVVLYTATFDTDQVLKAYVKTKIEKKKCDESQRT